MAWPGRGTASRPDRPLPGRLDGGARFRPAGILLSWQRAAGSRFEKLARGDKLPANKKRSWPRFAASRQMKQNEINAR